MSKKKKRNKKIVKVKVDYEKKDLNYFIEHFHEVCEHPKCQQKLVVHGYRSRSKNKREILYAHCENKGVDTGFHCPREMMEIAFIEKFI
jgi:hypothetical protein